MFWPHIERILDASKHRCLSAFPVHFGALISLLLFFVLAQSRLPLEQQGFVRFSEALRFFFCKREHILGRCVFWGKDTLSLADEVELGKRF